MHVVVSGPMGIGKTTTADQVAERLGRAVRDSDRDIEDLTGHTGAEIAADRGVDELHRLEAAVLLAALAEPDPLVVAAAASVLDDPACARALEAHVVVGLEAPVELIVERATSGTHRRSLDPAAIADLSTRRLADVSAAADVMVRADQGPSLVVDDVMAALAERGIAP